MTPDFTTDLRPQPDSLYIPSKSGTVSFVDFVPVCCTESRTSFFSPTVSWKRSVTPRRTETITQAVLANTWTSTSTSREIRSADTSTTTCWKRLLLPVFEFSPREMGVMGQLEHGSHIFVRILRLEKGSALL